MKRRLCISLQKICNRDIKPENTLLDEHGCVRISDFGFSKSEIFDSKPDSYCGTRAYMAPEVRRWRTVGSDSHIW